MIKKASSEWFTGGSGSCEVPCGPLQWSRLSESGTSSQLGASTLLGILCASCFGREAYLGRTSKNIDAGTGKRDQ